MKRKLVIPLCMLVILSTLAGCGSTSESYASAPAESAAYDSADLYTNSYAVEEAADYDIEYEEAMDDAVSAGNEQAERVEESDASSDRKLIRNVDMDVETEEYDELLLKLEQKIKELGGYIENSSTYNNSSSSYGKSARSAYITARIPAKRLDDFLGAVAEQSNVTRKSESVEDVTLTYVDLESHKKALKEEEKRLLDMMGDAETIEDLIAIEDRLTNVRYQIESMESQLRTYDNQVNYSTVTMSISEVERYTPVEEETTGQRIRRGFAERVEAVGEGLKEFGIGFVIHIPDFIVAAVIIVIIILIIYLIVRGRRKHRERKKHGRNPEEGGGAD